MRKENKNEKRKRVFVESVKSATKRKVGNYLMFVSIEKIKIKKRIKLGGYYYWQVEKFMEPHLRSKKVFMFICYIFKTNFYSSYEDIMKFQDLSKKASSRSDKVFLFHLSYDKSMQRLKKGLAPCVRMCWQLNS